MENKVDKKIFMYTEDARVPSQHLTALKKEGYLLLRVRSVLDYKIIHQAEPEFKSNELVRAALAALHSEMSPYYGAKNFVDALYEATKQKS